MQNKTKKGLIYIFLAIAGLSLVIYFVKHISNKKSKILYDVQSASVIKEPSTIHYLFKHFATNYSKDDKDISFLTKKAKNNINVKRDDFLDIRISTSKKDKVVTDKYGITDECTSQISKIMLDDATNLDAILPTNKKLSHNNKNTTSKNEDNNRTDKKNILNIESYNQDLTNSDIHPTMTETIRNGVICSKEIVNNFVGDKEKVDKAARLSFIDKNTQKASNTRIVCDSIVVGELHSPYKTKENIINEAVIDDDKFFSNKKCNLNKSITDFKNDSEGSDNNNELKFRNNFTLKEGIYNEQDNKFTNTYNLSSNNHNQINKEVNINEYDQSRITKEHISEDHFNDKTSSNNDIINVNDHDDFIKTLIYSDIDSSIHTCKNYNTSALSTLAKENNIPFNNDKEYNIDANAKITNEDQNQSVLSKNDSNNIDIQSDDNLPEYNSIEKIIESSLTSKNSSYKKDKINQINTGKTYGDEFPIATFLQNEKVLNQESFLFDCNLIEKNAMAKKLDENTLGENKNRYEDCKEPTEINDEDNTDKTIELNSKVNNINKISSEENLAHNNKTKLAKKRTNKGKIILKLGSLVLRTISQKPSLNDFVSPYTCICTGDKEQFYFKTMHSDSMFYYYKCHQPTLKFINIHILQKYHTEITLETNVTNLDLVELAIIKLITHYQCRTMNQYEPSLQHIADNFENCIETKSKFLDDLDARGFFYVHENTIHRCNGCFKLGTYRSCNYKGDRFDVNILLDVDKYYTFDEINERKITEDHKNLELLKKNKTIKKRNI